ncbi:helix-turn-helix domain containing protein [Microcystis aeruginosa CS-567/02-A1]|uniref:helix-turn-helix domain-containing protein n=1 Tax=Microcystis aeruginosa TaxID=1126 RepID=UPI0023301A3E|nr:helix-turn-helix domain-containing protein [Microcystis aeruginosa]MDB9402534.1 helix-turn-helix domain containing protein [Microcystis aeruginosa CS-567/02-A1]
MGKYSAEKKEIFRLFEQGYSIKYACSKLPHVSNRTVYNWHKEYIQSGGNDRRKNADIEAITRIQSSDISPEEWIDYAEKTSEEILTSNAKIRVRLEELLWHELGKPEDVNTRAINSLVSCLCVIQKQEYLFGSFAYLDINRAIKLLDSLGYKVQELPNE